MPRFQAWFSAEPWNREFEIPTNGRAISAKNWAEN
jgi:hypothetical protein